MLHHHLWQSAAQSCKTVSDTNKYIINSEKLPVAFAYFCLFIFQCHGNFFGNADSRVVLLCCWVLDKFKERLQKRKWVKWLLALRCQPAWRWGRHRWKTLNTGFPISTIVEIVTAGCHPAQRGRLWWRGRPRWDWFRDRGMIRPAPVNGPLCLLLAPALTNHFPQAPQRSHQSWEGTDHFQGPLRTSHHPPKHPLAISDIFLQGAHMDGLG